MYMYIQQIERPLSRDNWIAALQIERHPINLMAAIYVPMYVDQGRAGEK